MFDLLMLNQENPSLWISLVAFLIGLGLHIAKKCFVEELSIRAYLGSEVGRTTLSALGLAGAFTTVSTLYPQAPFIIYFLCGYSIDSFLNKAPKVFPTVTKEE